MITRALPASVTLAFTHAEIQALAVDHGIDVLHIKGLALDDSLRRPVGGSEAWRTSIDEQ